MNETSEDAAVYLLSPTVTHPPTPTSYGVWVHIVSGVVAATIIIGVILLLRKVSINLINK